ncbi:Short-chain dehydrogenase/reductase [Pseudozyma hubeiensis]|nr:Short-chain dehydrogenase/reductase [Pseudozyma hubeiensis]
MVSYSELAKKNASVDVTGQRALVAGGTQGIGAGIALRFALSGASVWLIGRSESRASEVLDLLNKASLEASRRSSSSSTSSSAADHQFFKADLSSPAGVTDVASCITTRAGKHGIDYLIETAGGPPTGTITTTPDGFETQFAVQVLSRVGLAKQLVEAGTVKRAVFMVAAPAQGGSSPVDVDDLDFTKTHAAGKWWSGPLGMYRKGARSSSILDAASQHLAEIHPNLTFTHVFPGIINTNAMENQGYNRLIVAAAKIFGPLVGSKPGPGGYAELPFYLLANDEGRRYLEVGKANLMDQNLKKLQISPNVKDKGVRSSIWDKLSAYFA